MLWLFYLRQNQSICTLCFTNNCAPAAAAIISNLAACQPF